MESISVILFALFVGVCSYFIGLHRGNSNNKYEYDRGYEDGVRDGLTIPLPTCSTDDDKWEAARRLVEELDDLFFYDDENNEEQLEE